MSNETTNPELDIRIAEEADIPLILRFIRELAAYEKLEAEVVATEALLHESLFVKRQAQVLIATYRGEPVGFALFFHSYSTFLGRANLYLEDFYVRESHRRLGIGRALFRRLAQICAERGCARMDWACLNWNTPSMAFYTKMGAKPITDWTVFRLQGQALQDLAK